ncbi:MAG: thiamine pyrophosphate-dependent enzyme [Pseudomonadota bacterium]|nr:thiamine pyrophosphate-dependent enzyme [Pseudomonadota bacterium]
MAVNRAGIVDNNFVAQLRALPPPSGGAPRGDLDAPVRAGAALTARRAIALFETQVESRHLDLAARALKARNECFYTIGSSGHEGNAAVAAALRPDDPAFLHYRSGAFFIERGRQVPGATPLMDVLLGLAASKDEPIAGGRHKVFGSLPLAIPPQTSTIASHLPKALGMALAIERAKRLGLPSPDGATDERIVVCTFGDASANHSTATGAINAAEWHAHQGKDCPLLFVCEDNGIGISTPTPEGWIATQYANRANLAYVAGDGLDLPDVADAAEAAVRWVRTYRRPCLLHVRTVRLLGHAGSDVEATYRSPEEIAAAEALDPLLRTAALLVSEGWLSPEAVVGIYEDTRTRIAALGEEAIRRPKLTTRAEVMVPLAPRHPDRVRAEAVRPAPPAERQRIHHGTLPEDDKPRHLAVQINRALADLFAKYPDALLFGEDVGKKGGVYHVTNDLQKRFGAERVIDTLLDEQTILGMALGAGQAGQLPFPEIQYLAYFHNACDQIRGEAGSLQYFSNGQFQNPMVCRIAGYAYQKGFGGHFHNDNSIAALRDIPGLVIASPARGDDAAAMLRTCAAAARVDGAVCLYLEPIALYMTRDLHEDGDGAWAAPYPPADHHVPIGSGRTYGDGADLTIVSWANGLWMSLRAARVLEAQHGIRCRVLDLRWILPLPVEDLVREVRATGRVLVVDECRATGGLSEGIYTALIDAGVDAEMARVAGADVYVPLGGAANLVLVQEAEIVAAALALAPRRGVGAAPPLSTPPLDARTSS